MMTETSVKVETSMMDSTVGEGGVPKISNPLSVQNIGTRSSIYPGSYRLA